MKVGHRVVPFSANRRMLAASVAVDKERHIIHSITEVDITEPRRLIREHRQHTGEGLSLTAHVIACLARAVVENPGLNSFRRGRKLVILDDVTISVLIERELDGERIPEPLGIRAAQAKTYRQIHNEIRAAQSHEEDHLGGLSGMGWVRLIPGFLLRAFIRAASHSVSMAGRYGVVSVTAVGMFGKGPAWFIPLSAATVLVTVGGIVERPTVRDGSLEEHEHLCLTVSFDHDLVDGAPAARFIRRLTDLIASGEGLLDAVAPAPSEQGSQNDGA